MLYVRYDRCNDDKTRSIKQYSEDLIARLDQGGVTRLIFDLRKNGGGNSALLDPLIGQLGRRPEFKVKGSLITLIGPGTFSSAQLNAVKLRDQAHSVLIGGSTGQKPNAYGEIKHFDLPNSRIAVWYSTKRFVTEPGDPPSTMPDILAETTIVDYLSGRDPALEAAMAYHP
jgi:C-terminal processing protease CtpA/Prc